MHLYVYKVFFFLLGMSERREKQEKGKARSLRSFPRGLSNASNAVLLKLFIHQWVATQLNNC